MKAYFCTSFGDISIEEGKEGTVILRTTDLTSVEETMLKELIKKFKLNNLSDKESLENMEVPLENVKLEDLHKHMKKMLKKNKPTITAIKYKDNRIELVEDLKDLKSKDGEAAKPDVAVTVDKPVLHCPMPTQIKSEVRASAVLNLFLDDTQKRDFEKHMQIVSTGNWSHKPYLITSRYSLEVEKFGLLYDITNRRTVCAKNREIPPSEEMLSLKLMIEHREFEFLGH